jgi:hypothetical protein
MTHPCQNYETNPTTKGTSVVGQAVHLPTSKPPTEITKRTQTSKGATVVEQAVSPANFQATDRNYETNPNEQGSNCGGAGGFTCQLPSHQKLRNEPKADRLL